MVDTANGLAIDLHHVAKTYRGRVQALRGVAMEVQPGEIFGLLGPNGAGKSTLVKIMMTVVRPNRAEGHVLGERIGHKPTLRKVGYLPEHHRFGKYLTGRQVLEYYGALAKVDRPARKRRACELLELVDAVDWADRKTGTYSKGQMQRVGLAQALMNEPDLVILDEPTDGLDPVGRHQVREMLIRLRDQGKTVFLNSHLLGEVERVCDRVAILHAGTVIRQGTVDELTSHGRYYEIRLAPNEGTDLFAAIRAALPCRFGPAESGRSPSGPMARGALTTGEVVEVNGATVRVITDRAEAVQPILDALRAGRLTIQSVAPIRQSLEDMFIQTVSAIPVARPVSEGGQS